MSPPDNNSDEPVTPKPAKTFTEQDFLSYTHDMNVATPLFPRGKGQMFSDPPPSREWWDINLEPVARRMSKDTSNEFVLRIPEHLPSSPLCPMHPKHKSGGRGVCVYHGRRRSQHEASEI